MMANGTTRTIWDIRPGELLLLDRRILVELVEKSGRLARLRVTAPCDVKIEHEASRQFHWEYGRKSALK